MPPARNFSSSLMASVVVTRPPCHNFRARSRGKRHGAPAAQPPVQRCASGAPTAQAAAHPIASSRKPLYENIGVLPNQIHATGEATGFSTSGDAERKAPGATRQQGVVPYFNRLT